MIPLFTRHPMERMESLYSNKFSNLRDIDKVPANPFRSITKQIINKRVSDPGPMFNSTITPNELLEYVHLK